MKIIAKGIFLIFLLSGCQSQEGWFDYSRPASLKLTPPPGTPEYQQGWSEGCKSALATVNTDVNLMLASYEYKIDGDLWKTNKRYRTTWKDAYYYCSYHMFTWLMQKY